MEKLIKENILYILIVVFAFAGGIYGVYTVGMQTWDSLSQMRNKKEELSSKQQKLEQLKQQKLSQKHEKKKESESGKIIYEVLEQQFTPEASFGIMFENVLSNITNSGLRIRTIDYNYSPVDDKILQANVNGYNACELGFTTVGTYTQLQTFLKNIAKENYLTSINELYIRPYDKNKAILISKFKIRLYTKTI